MKTVTRARRLMGGSDWDVDDPTTSKTHFVDASDRYTLCGVRIGTPDKGWIAAGYWDANCARCTKKAS